MASVGRGIGRELSQPKRQAFWGAYLVTTAICARKRVPMLTAMVMGSLMGAAAAKAWQLAEDVHQVAVLQSAAYDQITQPAPEPAPQPAGCCVCGEAVIGYTNYCGQKFCWPCANGDNREVDTDGGSASAAGA